MASPYHFVTHSSSTHTAGRICGKEDILEAVGIRVKEVDAMYLKSRGKYGDMFNFSGDSALAFHFFIYIVS